MNGVNVPLNQILLISDATTGGVLYSLTNGNAASYSQGTNSVLTLKSGVVVGSSDKLTIYYDDGLATNSPTNVSVSNFPATQTVAGSVSVSNFPASTEISNDAGNPIPVSGSVTATISGTPTVSISGTVPVSGTFYQATQPVSLTSLPSLATGSNTIGSVNVLGGNATAVKVDGSAVTQPISASSLPLPTNAAQDGVDGTGITAPTGGSGIRGWLSGIYNKLSNSLTVTASNLDVALSTRLKPADTLTGVTAVGSITNALPAGTNSIGQVTANAGTNLNTSSLALESGGNLATIATNTGKIPSKGTATIANSTPVNIASDQTVPTSVTIPSAFKTGQSKIAVTGTAVQLGSNTLTQGVLITALSTNAASITIGTSSSLTNVVDGTGNGAILTAGSTKSIAATNTNLIWINGTAGDIISFIGS